MQARQHSVSRRLTVAVVVTVVTVTSITMSLIYLDASRKAKAELGAKADEYVASLAIALETPLWNLDQETLENIGKAYADNDLVERFQIVNFQGNVSVDLDRRGSDPLVTRSREIHHGSSRVGSIEISLTSKHYLSANRNLVWSGGIAIIANTIALVLATGFLLRMFLNKPLKRLGETVSAYAAGRYDAVGHSTECIEFQPLVEVLEKMGDTISSQMAELKLAEMKYRGIFENATEGIFQTSSEGRFISVNPAFARILGYDSPAELIEKVTDIGRQLYVDPAHREAYKQALMRDGTVTGFEILFQRKDGSQLWVSENARSIKDEHGQLVLIEGFLEDITEWKLGQEALATANESLRRTQDELEIRVRERTLDLGEANEKLLNEVAERKRAELEVAERNHELETANRELKNAQIKLLQAQKLESIGQLAAGIAHEINTPIQFVGDNTRFFGESIAKLTEALARYEEALMGAARGVVPTPQEVAKLREDYDLDYILSELPMGVRETLDGVNRISTIVLALKEFSHPDSREKVHTDLNAALQSTTIVCRNEWKYLADLNLDLDAHLPLVPCLPGEMNQVFMNLIVNAAHAIEEKVGHSGQKGVIDISTRLEDGQVVIRVKDTGTGIRPENLGRIFDPFYTTKEVGRGTGQGLAISRNIVVEKHSGRIDVESVVGEGTTIVIRLPFEVA
jgi:PAS domain S-box-containing protein